MVRKRLFDVIRWLDTVQHVDARERTDLWRKTLELLNTIKIDRERFSEMEALVEKIKTDLAESARADRSTSSNNSYEQHYLVAKLQSTLEGFRREAEELGRLEKSLQTLCQKMGTELKIREQIREQLRKKLEIVARKPLG